MDGIPGYFTSFHLLPILDWRHIYLGRSHGHSTWFTRTNKSRHHGSITMLPSSWLFRVLLLGWPALATQLIPAHLRPAYWPEESLSKEWTELSFLGAERSNPTQQVKVSPKGVLILSKLPYACKCHLAKRAEKNKKKIYEGIWPEPKLSSRQGTENRRKKNHPDPWNYLLGVSQVEVSEITQWKIGLNKCWGKKKKWV